MGPGAGDDARVTTSGRVAEERRLPTLLRNLGSGYVLVAVNVAIGLLVLPFNVRHLGSETYGLWMLAATITSYLGVLDLGYGGAIVKFVAEFRAKNDPRALNEVLSTMATVFTGIGLICYVIAAGLAVGLPYVFNLQPGQETLGRIVLLVLALQIALYFRFSIYGAVVNGFEQYYLNSIVGLVFNVTAAMANVLVLWLGYGLVELVVTTTLIRIAPLWIYRWNAYRVFPGMRIRHGDFQAARLRDLTRFTLYFAASGWATRLTYTSDTFYLGFFMNTTAVAVYAVAQRISEALLNLTQQVHSFLLPAVVERASGGNRERQQALMIKATRLQLAIAVCLCGGVAVSADLLIHGWVGPGWEGSVMVTRMLALVVILRAWMAMPITVLQGSGDHKFAAAALSATAVANLVLSVPLVQVWGLVGVTVGTIIPAFIGGCIIFHRACRIVGADTREAVTAVVWPALWPALIVMTLLRVGGPRIPAGLFPALLQLAGGGVLYVLLFVAWGLGRTERSWLMAELRRAITPRQVRAEQGV